MTKAVTPIFLLSGLSSRITMLGYVVMLRDVICNYQSINQSINLLLYGRSNAGLHELVTVAYLHHVLLNICSVDYFHALQNTHTHARTHARTHTHTHPFNGPLSGTTRVSRYQKSKTNLDFTEIVGKPSATGQPTRPTQPFILSGSINE